MSIVDVNKAHKDYVLALHVQDEVDAELEAAQTAYDAELAKLLEANPEFKAKKERLEQAQAAAKIAKDGAQDFREKAKEELSFRFYEKGQLPEHFSQQQSHRISYNERTLFLAALQHDHTLLTIDDKAVQKLIKLAEEREIGGKKQLTLPERYDWMLPMKLVIVPKPIMPEEKLRKLKTVDLPEEEKTKEPVLVSTQPKLSEPGVKEEKPSLTFAPVPPTEQIDC